MILAAGGDKLAHFEKRLELEITLESLIGRPVHVVDLELAPLFLYHQVLKTGRLIVDKDPARRITSEVAARRRYFDMRRVYDRRSEAVFRLLETRHG